jgi:hypothetical protein
MAAIRQWVLILLMSTLFTLFCCRLASEAADEMQDQLEQQRQLACQLSRSKVGQPLGWMGRAVSAEGKQWGKAVYCPTQVLGPPAADGRKRKLSWIVLLINVGLHFGEENCHLHCCFLTNKRWPCVSVNEGTNGCKAPIRAAR